MRLLLVNVVLISFSCRALEAPGRPEQYTNSIAATEAISEFAHAVAEEFRRRMRHTLETLRQGAMDKSDDKENKENKPPGDNA